jgi:hypothetical protein
LFSGAHCRVHSCCLPSNLQPGDPTLVRAVRVVLAVVLVAVAAGVPGAGLRPAALIIGHRCPLGGKTLITVCQLLDPGADGRDALGGPIRGHEPIEPLTG